jgi:hypothetical protein
MVSCASMGSMTLEDLNVALVDLQREAVAALPLGKRSQSQNARTFYSEYFVYSKGEYESGNAQPVRHYAEITILGDRRPYKMEIRVAKEVRESDGRYVLSNYDEGLTRVITRRIQSALHKRREDRNIIDDFRVF